MAKRFRIRETGVELVKIEEHVDPTKDIFSPANSDNGRWYHANEFPALGLTLEPIEEEKPKRNKLYAYRNGEVNIQWFSRIIPNTDNRAPEYDIDFPIGEPKMGEVK